ncbi:D-glycero-alpha-D-manno-heptose-1,7-bisphosphate 7-phosphatase [Rugamonas rubra]|uniref:D,D-heptose 1,7-bisphosphate phosphatase n=1 Tax=Rugamonas rubra TaxID=758825 RepID=A0A1I4N0A8_9BURK|nr:HAD-IIIA family hydrolase [Rugamonas rubra]SFM08908.1 D-glycero-D-manno-heptose 1,7-bisphosphate phosphatase [Rugamonas rubra]
MRPPIPSAPAAAAPLRPRADGIWFELFGAAPRAGRPALFVDRDGVLVEDCHYLRRAEDVALLDGAAAALAEANRLDMPVIVVTNQAGVGRGYYDWPAFAAVNRRMLDGLAAGGARVDAVVACPFHADGVGRYRQAGHPMRKPRPGMLLLAGRALAVDFAASLVVGDQLSDLRAGQAAGLRRGVHVLSGHGAQGRAAAARFASAAFAVELVGGIGDAAVLRALQQQGGAG